MLPVPPTGRLGKVDLAGHACRLWSSPGCWILGIVVILTSSQILLVKAFRLGPE
jgi:hypothetical protein